MKSFDPIIEIIEEGYEIPHLDAARKISALLPYDYYDTKEHYPVLYLQDGQNLFNPDAPYGDWAINKSMNMLAEKGFKNLIIIAVDHGEKERIREYLPYHHPKFGKGRGSYYIQFMKEKLIPYVNKRYRTLTDYVHTGVGGSSMGGLISLYAGITEPEVFGQMMIFSPSLWVSGRIYYDVESYKALPGSGIYLYAGGKESKAHLPNVKKLESILQEKINNEASFHIKVSVNKHGEHGEVFWGKEFPKAIKWLFFKNKQ